MFAKPFMAREDSEADGIFATEIDKNSFLGEVIIQKRELCVKGILAQSAIGHWSKRLNETLAFRKAKVPQIIK